jgi:excisionase family DNA binding protein
VFEDIKLLTAAEVADILRMNKQVILRKLQSGEIEGYKLDKDWRIKESSLHEWLESHSNQRVPDEKAQILKSFFDPEGRLVSIPSRRKKRLVILDRLLQEFEPDRDYPEIEVNEILRRFHEDVCTLRREFIANKLMVREASVYRRTS